MDKLKQLAIKYKSYILYLVFGVGTTLINMVVYYLCAHPLGWAIAPSTIVAWFFSVLFAYLTNRSWVFGSEAHTARALVREAVSFFLCRLATGVLDLIIMEVTVTHLGCRDLAMKLCSNIIVIVLNYLASRLMIFRHKDAKEN